MLAVHQDRRLPGFEPTFPQFAFRPRRNLVPGQRAHTRLMHLTNALFNNLLQACASTPRIRPPHCFLSNVALPNRRPSRVRVSNLHYSHLQICSQNPDSAHDAYPFPEDSRPTTQKDSNGKSSPSVAASQIGLLPSPRSDHAHASRSTGPASPPHHGPCWCIRTCSGCSASR